MKHDNDDSKSEDEDWEHPPEIPHINVENRNIESGEATEEKITQAIDQLQNLMAVNESMGVVSPNSFERAVKEVKWKDAMIDELSNIGKRNVWEEIELGELPPNTKCLGTKWVYTVKNSMNKIKYKARLVVLGCYQRPGIDFTEVYSPVASDSTIRMMLCIANYKNWEIQQIDVEAAFLNAPLKETVYIKIPKGYELIGKKRTENVTLKLNRALYGLVQAPKAWMETFIKELTKLGCTRSWADPCLLIIKEEEQVVLGITVYVDDCLIVGRKEKVTHIIEEIGKLFAIKKKLGMAKKYLGYEIKRDVEKGSLTLRQKEYINGMRVRYGIDPGGIKTPMKCENPSELNNEEADLKEYQSVVGTLLYASKSTRPDIANAVRNASQNMVNPRKGHMDQAYRIAQYLINHVEEGITYDQSDGLEMTAYVDSNYADKKEDRKSVTGYIIMLGGGTIEWKSQCQGTVSLSSTEAEYKALSQCASGIVYLIQVLKDLGIEMKTTTIYEDNVGAIKLAENWSSTKRTKHIDVRHHYVRELMEKEIIEIKHVSSENQPADMLTKNVPKATFEKHKRFIMNLN